VRNMEYGAFIKYEEIFTRGYRYDAPYQYFFHIN